MYTNFNAFEITTNFLKHLKTSRVTLFFPLSSPLSATSSLLDTDVVHVAYLGPEKSHSLSRLSLAARGIFASKFLPTLFRLHNGRRRFGGGGMFYTRRLAQLLGFEEAISGECMCCRDRQAG